MFPFTASSSLTHQNNQDTEEQSELHKVNSTDVTDTFEKTTPYLERACLHRNKIQAKLYQLEPTLPKKQGDRKKKAWDVSHSFMLSSLSKRTVKGHNPSMQQKLSFPGLSYKVNRPSVIFLGKSNAIANTIFRASPSFNFLETPSVIVGFSPPLLNLSPTSAPKYRFHFCVQRSRNIPHLVWQHLYF